VEDGEADGSVGVDEVPDEVDVPDEAPVDAFDGLDVFDAEPVTVSSDEPPEFARIVPTTAPTTTTVAAAISPIRPRWMR
jgi:hypothetical protein